MSPTPKTMTSRRFLIGSIVAVLLLAAAPAAAQSKKQLENDKAKVEQEIKRLNSDLASAKKNSRSSQQQITLLEKKITERTKLINNINGQLNLLTIRMSETQDSIRVMKVRIDSLKAEYAKTIRVLYGQRGNLDQMTLLLDTRAYSRAYLRMRFFREYSNYRRRQAAFIRLKEKELNDVGDELQRQQREQTSLIEQQMRQKDELAREQKQQQQQLKDSKQKEKKLQQQIAQKEKQKRQLQQQIQRIIDEEVAKARKNKKKNTTGTTTVNKTATDADVALSNDFASNKGKLPWPVSYNKVEREFGRYTHASGGQNMNNGIDLVCPPGAAVKSVFNGVVTRVFTGPDGTKGVIVRHGSYMTVYAHLGTVTVSEGTKVKTGQNLGTVYTNSNGTAEFSFQLWNEKTVQNPRKWLK